MIRNTENDAKDPAGAMLLVAASMGRGGSSRVIAEQERAGQAQLVNSEQLPTDLDGDNPADFEALGIVFGEPTPGDRLFQSATLPEGWKREASDHDMWSYVVDELGRRRIAVFYKAAFYDRRAFMRLDTLDSYVFDCQYKGRAVITDSTWATPAAVAAAATRHAKNSQARVDEWKEIAADRGSSPDVERYAAEYAAQRDAFLAIAAVHEAATEA